MSMFKKLLIGLVTIVFVANTAVLLTTIGDQAEATKLFDKFLEHKKSGKCDVPPTWGGVIPGDRRFVPTFVGSDRTVHAYIDCQTGLVWDAEPSGATFPWGPEQEDVNNPTSAIRYCINRTAPWLGQKGGRLPSIPELASLVDTTSSTCTGGGGSICLPDGHPFKNVPSSFYWSASEVAGMPSTAWDVLFFTGDVSLVDKGRKRRAWCVRGAMNADAY